MSDRSQRFCFTVNNPTDDDRSAVATFCDGPDCLYAIVGREVAESTGTPHLQGYVYLARRYRRGILCRSLGGRAFLESSRGTHAQNRNYCSKGGDFDEYGVQPVEPSPGKRNDLEDCFAWALTFEDEHGRPPSSPDLAKHFPGIYCKYPRVRATIEKRAKPIALQFGELREWQRELEVILETEPDDRVVQFILDSDGNKGKSWFCRYMLTKCPEKVQILGIGKRDDIAHMVDETKSIFMVNVPRGGMEFVQYTIFEQLKDRVVISPKYASRVKFLRAKCHVVVMCNEDPDQSKMSLDRFNIIRI